MQFCNLLLCSTQEPGAKSWAEPLPRLVKLAMASVISVFVMRGRARKAWGLRIAIFIIIVFGDLIHPIHNTLEPQACGGSVTRQSRRQFSRDIFLSCLSDQPNIACLMIIRGV